MRKARRLVGNIVPDRVRVFLYKVEQALYDARLMGISVNTYRELDNVYHCTVHKAGSQWFRTLFFDTLIFQKSGLRPWFTGLLGIHDMDYKKEWAPQLPVGRIVTPLYISYRNFRRMRKPNRYRILYVIRDPRDLVVSFYFSLKYTHSLMGDVGEKRKILATLNKKDGLLWVIEHFHKKGVFDAMREWINAQEEEPNLLVVKLEDLGSNHRAKILKTALHHCGVPVSDDEVRRLLEKYGLERLRAKDHRTTRSGLSHYRSGQAGDWRNHFNNETARHLQAYAGDLIEALGYDA